jgi:hypothetical protein
MSTRDLLGALTQLTRELDTLIAGRPDLAELCDITVASPLGYRTPGQLHLAGRVAPVEVLAWCDAVEATTGRCLGGGEDMVTVTATGRVGGLPTDIPTRLPRTLAEWTVQQLRELLGAPTSTEPAGGAR